MLRAGYNIQVAAGAVTAGGCLGILIPPSVLLIVYGATAGVSVVQLYAGAFFPGLHAGRALRRLRDRAGEDEAAARCRRCRRASAASRCRRSRSARAARPQRVRRAARAACGRASACRSARCWRSCSSSLLPALVIAGLLIADATQPRPRRWSRRAPPGWSRPAARSPRASRRRNRRPDRLGLRRSRRRERQELSPPPAAEEAKPAASARQPQPRQPRRRHAGGRRARAPVPTWFWIFLAVRAALIALALLALDLGAARGVQDAARLVLPARAADPRGAGLDRVRPGHAGRSGGGRRLRRLPAGRRLPLHRALARAGRSGAAPGPRTKEIGAILKESSFLTAKTTRDGVLAVRRLVDLLGGVRAARRPGDDREVGAVART